MGIVSIIEQYRSGNKINALLLPNLMLGWNLKGFSECLECNNNYGTNCNSRTDVFKDIISLIIN